MKCLIFYKYPLSKKVVAKNVYDVGIDKFVTWIFRTLLKDDNADYIPIYIYMYIEQSRPPGEVSVTKRKQNGFQLNDDVHLNPRISRRIETKGTMYETMHHMAQTINYTTPFC